MYFRDKRYLVFILTAQVAFTGGRVVDNATVFEPQMARTHKDFLNMGIYQASRHALIGREILPRWPSVSRVRIVSAAVNEMKQRRDRFRIIEHSFRVGRK